MQTKSPKLALAWHLPAGESECPWQIQTYKMLYSRSFNLAIWEVHSLPLHAFNFKLLQSSEKPLYWIYYSLAHMLQGRGSWCFTFRLLQTWRLLSRPLHVPIIISLPLYITASVFSVSVFIRNLWSHYPHFDIQLPLTLKGLKCLNTTLSSAPKYKCCVSRRNILTELGMQIPNSGPTVTCWSTWIFFLPNEKKFCGHKALQSATNNSWDTYDKLYCQMILPSPLYVIHLFPNTQPQSRRCVFFFCLAHEPVSLRIMSDKTIQDILSPTFLQTIPNLPRVGDEEVYLPYVAKE